MNRFYTAVQQSAASQPRENQPADIGLRDPGVGARADVLSQAFIVPGVAAAGLAVGLLTQSV